MLRHLIVTTRHVSPLLTSPLLVPLPVSFSPYVPPARDVGEQALYADVTEEGCCLGGGIKGGGVRGGGGGV